MPQPCPPADPPSRGRAVDVLRIHTVELAHTPREIRVRRLHQQVVVIRHLTPRMTAPVEPIAHTPEHVEPGLTIHVTGTRGSGLAIMHLRTAHGTAHGRVVHA
jgi:hypothetical protein